MLKHTFLAVLVIALGALFAIFALGPLSAMGTSDLRGYWSASYLLAHSENFADPDRLLEVQQEQTGHQHDYPVMAWNPPWLLVLLTPLTIVPFATAASFWLLFNIAAIFTAAVVCWRVYEVTESPTRLVFIAPFIAFAFQPALTTLLMGQVNTLVLLGLSLFLLFWKSDMAFLAGTALSLTMVKPHLVYVTLPLCLLHALVSGRRRVVTGFVTALALLSLIAFAFRPSFLSDYLGAILGQPWLIQAQAPTVSVALAIFTGWDTARYLGIIVLPFTLFLWHRNYRYLNMPTIVSVGTIISLATAPFGWSYDQILLLIPVTQLILTVLRTSARAKRLLLALGFVAINTYSFYLRIYGNNEFVFYWLAPALGLLYWFILRDLSVGKDINIIPKRETSLQSANAA